MHVDDLVLNMDDRGERFSLRVTLNEVV